MAKFIIHGCKKLNGEISVMGAKNEATKLIAASILVKDNVILDNVPKILAVETMLKILRNMGAKADWSGRHQVALNCRNIDPTKIDQKTINQERATFVIAPALLTRFKELEFAFPGGCDIGSRSFDTHLDALKCLGINNTLDKEKEMFSFWSDSLPLKGNEIVLREFSVTATESLLIAASLAKGETILKIAAAEPHVSDLAEFLNKMGAKIKKETDHTFRINGVEKLHGGIQHTVIPDMIETGTFACLAAATNSNIKIVNTNPSHLDLFLYKLEEFGVNFEKGSDYLWIKESSNLQAASFETNIYPGIPTDLQQPLGVLATQANGPSEIFEKMFEGRFGYADELQKMGAKVFLGNPHQIVISGITPLTGTEVKSLDLRAGATLVIAGLLAEGETVIYQAEKIDRGYEKIEERLQGLGANIERVE